MLHKNTIIVATLMIFACLFVMVYLPLTSDTPAPRVRTTELPPAVTTQDLPALTAQTIEGKSESAESPVAPDEMTPTLPEYTTATLAPYNGENSDLPIYIALEGKVYDVTAGKKFYEPGAVYHFLAGTDGTEVLKYVGGETIKKKYEVVGTFTP